MADGMGKRYKWLEDGDTFVFDPSRQYWRQACCSCGLTHDIYMKIRGKKIMFLVFRNEHATAQIRRRNLFECIPGRRKKCQDSKEGL